MLTRLAAILSISVVFASGGLPASAREAAAARDRNSHHVLLISVDGLHASDLTRWVMERPDSRLAGLSRIGTTVENASSAEPSDSFPGLLAMLTGGTPRTTGVFYDDTYTR